MARSKVTLEEVNPWRIKEKNLAKHLEGEHEGDASAEKTKPRANLDLATRDYQLNEALTLLKGLHILKQTTVPKG